MRAGMAPRPRCIRQVSLWEAELDPSMGREQDDHVTLHSPQSHGLGPGSSAFCRRGMKAGQQGLAAGAGQGSGAGARTLGLCDGAESQAFLLDCSLCSAAQTPQD